MQRLYQWLSGRASILRSYTEHRGAGRVVRTETTLERQKTTLLVGTAAAAGFDVCPLCGNSLTSAQTDRNRPETTRPESDGTPRLNAPIEG
jgi:hypothetical protein